MTENNFQQRAAEWYRACFTEADQISPVERTHRFLEEALELAQASNCSREEAIELVDYVFGRKPGDAKDEVGGVMVTLAILCVGVGVVVFSSGLLAFNPDPRTWDTVTEKLTELVVIISLMAVGLYLLFDRLMDVPLPLGLLSVLEN